MHHDGNRSGQATYELSHGDNQREQQQGIESISHRAAVPAPVLPSKMDNRALIFQGWPDGPLGYLGRVDAVPLPRELAGPFGSVAPAPGINQDEAR